MKNTFLFVSIFLFLMFPLRVYADDSVANKNKQIDSTIKNLIQSLKKNTHIANYISNELIFNYNEYNRCDGNIDGTITLKPGYNIDQTINLIVTNYGNGWACDKKKKTKYLLKFDLKNKLKEYFHTISEQYDHTKRKLSIAGSTSSEFLEFYFKVENKQYLIYKLEYISEDPG